MTNSPGARRYFLRTAMIASPVAWAAPVSGKAVRVVAILTAAVERSKLNIPWVKNRFEELGWVEGRNIRYEIRHAEMQPERMVDAMRELMALNPDVIFTWGTTVSMVAVSKVNRTIPLVIGATGEMVATGIVNSLSRPGGNVTGMTASMDLHLKRIDWLREAVPSMRCLGAVSSLPAGTPDDMKGLAARFPIEVRVQQIAHKRDIDPVLTEMKRGGIDAVMFQSEPQTNDWVNELAAVAAALRLPSISEIRNFAEAGGLVFYGVNPSEMILHAVGHVDKILRGADPGALPVEQPTKIEMVINLRTAQALGLSLPAALLARAERVIR